MAKVFITNDCGHDYNDAKRYGELEFLTPPRMSVFSPGRVRHNALAELHEKGFNPEEDYICVVGSPVISLMIGIELRPYLTPNTTFKLLVFDAAEQSYKLREVKY